MLDTAPPADTTLIRWIGERVRRHGSRNAASFFDDDGKLASRVTYEELWRRSHVVAKRLIELHEASNDASVASNDASVGAEAPRVDPTDAPRAILLFPPGIDFLVGFFGCQIAGWIPVPTCYPKPGRAMPRLESAAADCEPRAIVSTQETLAGIDENRLCDAASHLARITTDTTNDELADVTFDWDGSRVTRDSLALLQYTSGSTSTPKGVMVSHANLMSNLNAIQIGFGLRHAGPDEPGVTAGVFWLPFYHDMGLIGGILATLYIGGSVTLHSPRSFLQRPIRWLQLISQHEDVVSGAPNFAYQLCVDRIPPEQTDSLDLACWKTAFCGAEPISSRTLTDFSNRFATCGFDHRKFYPCYGLAEATLLAAGGNGPGPVRTLTVDRTSLLNGKAKLTDLSKPAQRQHSQTLVNCGRPAHGVELVIVDPKTHRSVSERTIGEIWLRGGSVAAGYWQREQENEEQFQAQLARGVFAKPSFGGDDGFLRTGDLGFLHDGDLFVTGRLKDVVILRGRNHYPQDIEATVRSVIGEEAGRCAAFAVEAPRGEALAIVAEIGRHSQAGEFAELVRTIRREVIDVHEIDPRHVLLTRPAAIPVTTSGKIQRSLCREMFANNTFKTKHRYDRSSYSEQSPIPIDPLPVNATVDDRPHLTQLLQDWLAEWLIARAGVEPDDIDNEKPFADYGLDSMTAVELSGELEDWTGIELTPVVAWNHPTIAHMSDFIADRLCGIESNDISGPSVPAVGLETAPIEHH